MLRITLQFHQHFSPFILLLLCFKVPQAYRALILLIRRLFTYLILRQRLPGTPLKMPLHLNPLLFGVYLLLSPRPLHCKDPHSLQEGKGAQEHGENDADQ